MKRLLAKIFYKVHFALLRLHIKKVSSDRTLAEMLDGVLPAAHEKDLKDVYLEYVRDVSRADMAASYECVAFLGALSKVSSLRKLLDMGSGLSSFALRKFLTDNKQVWSVDDDGEWLEKTARFLRLHGVRDANLVMLNEFTASSERDFDLIFLDLNFVEVRKEYIRLVVDRLRAGGIIVFDDVHKPDFMYEVLNQGKRYGLTFFDIRAFTLDGFGRFALLGIKRS